MAVGEKRMPLQGRLTPQEVHSVHFSLVNPGCPGVDLLTYLRYPQAEEID